MATAEPALLAHREWLGQIGQVGLVVSANVLVKHGVFVNHQDAVATQQRLRDLIPEDDETFRVFSPERFFREVLEWPAELLAGGDGGQALPESLTVSLPAYEDYLAPTYAVPAPADVDGNGWLLLIHVVAPGLDLDRAAPADADGWRASPQARFERLLRETGVGIGLLFNGASVRLVYAPKGESSGYLTFTFKYLLQTQGRPMAGALHALLELPRVSDAGQTSQLLSTLLRESRKSQNDVSTELADQVLDALWELVRGFQHANEKSNGALLSEVLAEDSREVYGGLLTTLMRLVFVLYAEDRSLMPAGDVYQQHYSVAGLFQRLRDDQARYPDTMDARYGAWAQLLALFRLIHDGGQHGDLRFVAKHGRLFGPDAYPFLEGRAHGTTRSMGERVSPPKVSDGTVYRVLQNLLILDGERLSYRSLDVEQIGSVYEAMMGFALEQASAPSLAVGPKHIVIDLRALLDEKPSERAKWLKNEAEVALAAKSGIEKATSIDELVAAIGKKASRYTPMKVPVGALYLQPTEERRRSGSHYTPRSLTEPIVRTTFRPICDRLGDAVTPEAILDLKVCDPAMGSGAFLVESCRFLAERLVKAWEVHKATPPVPDDEDVLTYARRLVAERCLYGVDRNIFAVDLAKLSLWLATLAKDHPFTFLDHSLRHGDSLVGLSREQIASFNWDVEQQVPLLRGLINERATQALKLREQIQGLAASDETPHKARILREAEDALSDVRLIGDLVVGGFFELDTSKKRSGLRSAYLGQVQDWLHQAESSPLLRGAIAARAGALREGTQPVSPFHWEIEFPEVFAASHGGFDGVVGNPPFLGGTRVSEVFGMNYFQWLVANYPPAEHHCDLVAYFFRRGFDLLNDDGCLGFVATNTIAQGDTREGGLRTLLGSGGQIFSATRRLRWPGLAAVVVSVVHLSKRREVQPVLLDGANVDRISAYLVEGGMDNSPARLAEGPYFSLGSKIYGQGFLFADGDAACTPIAERFKLAAVHPDWAPRMPPYLVGEELNSDPLQRPSRYVIQLSDIQSEEALAQWPELRDIVEAKVKPERMRLGDNPNNVPLKKKWWAYQAHRPELYAALSKKTRALCLSRVGQTLAFAFEPTDIVFSEAVVVFDIDGWAGFAVLQSRIHEAWARFFSSSMKDDLRYTPSDCYETFPFPPDWSTSAELLAAGRHFYEFRALVMAQENEGLTKIYDRLHNPELHEPDATVVRLRQLQDAMDRAVLDAYGWSDIRPTCEFILDYEDEDNETETGKPSKKKKPYRYRWPDDVRDEVLGRLLKLNATRAKEEAAAGAVAFAKSTSGKRAKRQTESLF